MLEFRPVTTSFKAMAIKANFTKEDARKKMSKGGLMLSLTKSSASRLQGFKGLAKCA